MNNCCFDCEARSPACHAECAEYLAEYQANQERYKRNHAQAGIYDYNARKTIQFERNPRLASIYRWRIERRKRGG